ncbi:MAG: pyridoxine 5'-phosphate synthase [Ostreibacterium sp.]
MTKMTKLSVNLNKIALLRNARGRDFPNIMDFAELALKAGADGVTIHPRPDQRHARYDDIKSLKALCNHYNAELNVEGYPKKELIELCILHKVNQVTLVPDTPNQLTSDHGWAVSEHQAQLSAILHQLRQVGIRSSLFMDVNINGIQLAKTIGADRIELYTESYARSVENNTHDTHIVGFVEVYQAAIKAGLGVNAGHDLDAHNLGFFLGKVPVAEVSVGHALTVEALLNGWSATICHYKMICQKGLL